MKYLGFDITKSDTNTATGKPLYVVHLWTAHPLGPVPVDQCPMFFTMDSAKQSIRLEYALRTNVLPSTPKEG